MLPALKIQALKQPKIFLFAVLLSFLLGPNSVYAGDSTCTSNFTFQNISQSGIVEFSNKSTGVGLRYFWDFGDSSYSTQRNPVHVYDEPGDYNACLTAYSNSDTNCFAITCKTVSLEASDSCYAFFLYVKGINFNTISFINQSFLFGDSLKFDWTFGDGKGSNSRSPDHIYTEAGVYVVCLTVSDVQAQCSATFCDTVTIDSVLDERICESDFSYVLVDSVVYFSDESPGTYSDFFWTFGDGTTDSIKNPSHQYDSAGNYMVCLTVQEDTCEATTCKEIYYFSEGTCLSDFTVDLSLNQNGYNDNVRFVNHSVGKDLTFYWTFGDFQSSVERSPVHKYTSADTFSACLTISDTVSGCKSIYCNDVIVTEVEPPKVDIIIDKSHSKLYPSTVGPNPTRDVCTIELKEYKGPPPSLYIFDESGKKMWSYKKLSENKATINLQNYAGGFYSYIFVHGDELLSVGKIAKQ